MSTNYDMIATVDIDITNPIVEDTSYDKLCILGPAPAGNADVDAVTSYVSLAKAQAAGYVVSGDDADPVGVALRVAFAQSPAPTKVYVATQQLADGSDTDTEDILVTVQRAVADTGWYALCTAGVDSTEYETIAEYIEAQERMFLYTDLDFFANSEATVSGDYCRTAGIFGKENASQGDEEVPVENQYLHVAFAAKWLSYDPGTETAAHRTLTTVSPSELTRAQMETLVEANMNYFITIGNQNITMNGKVLGDEWMDVIRFRDWLKNDMQLRVVKLFIQNAKIPYTDAGIGLIHNAMLASLAVGQDVGGIAPDEYDDDGNLTPGYETSVPTAASLTASQRASRKLTDCKFKARISGAIHFAELTGSLTYEL